MIPVTLRSVVVMVVTIVVVMPVVAVVVVAMTVVPVMTVSVAFRATSVGVSDLSEVLGSGTHMQLLEHLVRAFVAEELGHTAVLITQVTKDDRIG